MALVVSAGRARWRRERPPGGIGREVPMNSPASQDRVFSQVRAGVCCSDAECREIQRRNAWRYYIRGVAFGDGRRPAGQSLKDAQELAGLPPGRWLGRGLRALGLTEGGQVLERQMELLFGEGRHPDADRIERDLLDDGVDAATARRRTVLGQPIEEIEARKQTPLLGMDFTFRPQTSLVVLWALGDAATRRVIERAHERAVATALRWLEDEVAETRWASGRGRAKTPALVVAAFRHIDNRDGPGPRRRSRSRSRSCSHGGAPPRSSASASSSSTPSWTGAGKPERRSGRGWIPPWT